MLNYQRLIVTSQSPWCFVANTEVETSRDPKKKSMGLLRLLQGIHEVYQNGHSQLPLVHGVLSCASSATWVGKCPFLGILNITFKYLLEIISPILGWCSIGTFTNPCQRSLEWLIMWTSKNRKPMGFYHQILVGFSVQFSPKKTIQRNMRLNQLANWLGYPLVNFHIDPENDA